ncbi:hypothetical protein HYH03_009207 [Edaphochlamys debaryana]|uniref:Uncharacterized protein n=1 Tax=Edaphochlamys debaryana TaxID=47281 RepID=A0A835XWR9_9CHLO|nr:hypothetical protein HYH03_009207 [Edaphochlamys debaryana]|eukprot:KAG2492542.1 hypothetical protein HYH03_009207 [Edaphochlamys debaryana]
MAVISQALFRLSPEVDKVLQQATQCAEALTLSATSPVWLPAAGAALVAGMEEGPVRGRPITHVLLTDNATLRHQAAAGQLAPWVSPLVQALHMEVHDPASVPGGATSNATAAAEALARAHIASLADFGILVKATCVVYSPSGFSNQAQLLRRNRGCAALLGVDGLSEAQACSLGLLGLARQGINGARQRRRPRQESGRT